MGEGLGLIDVGSQGVQGESQFGGAQGCPVGEAPPLAACLEFDFLQECLIAEGLLGVGAAADEVGKRHRIGRIEHLAPGGCAAR